MEIGIGVIVIRLSSDKPCTGSAACPRDGTRQTRVIFVDAPPRGTGSSWPMIRKGKKNWNVPSTPVEL